MDQRARQVARVLADLRERHGLTQEQAAARVPVTVRQWQRWEAGESTPYPRNLDLIATRFDFNVCDFFDNQNPRDPSQLDRIESKLDALLERLGVSDPADELEALLDEPDPPSEDKDGGTVEGGPGRAATGP